jgi:hypothetical protein
MVLGVIAFLEVGAVVVIALRVLDFWLNRFFGRAMFKLIDRDSRDIVA